ncbi:MAG: hypothetical protein JSV13_08130 [Nitrospiraceae bacterium]|jgi:hypothetical protein|nr:MAG: hypothetical protein JSV13_08130 [Nitrospiraceae bacterium]
MSKKTILLLGVPVITAILIFVLWPSDKSRIKKLFNEGTQAVIEENLEEVMSKVSYHYSDDHGASYLFLQKGFERFFQKLDNFVIEYEIKDMSITDKRATVKLDLSVIATYGQDTGYILGDAGEHKKTVFYLEKERTTWLVIKTEGIQWYY